MNNFKYEDGVVNEIHNTDVLNDMLPLPYTEDEIEDRKEKRQSDEIKNRRYNYS